MDYILTAHLILITFSLILILRYIQFHWKRRQLYKIASQYDGPRTLPIIGNALKIIMPLTEIAQRITEGCIYYKSPIRLWFGSHLAIVVWDPENIKIILNSQHALNKQPHLCQMFEQLTGHGVLTSRVDEWKLHRKLIAPAFKQAHFQGFFDVLNCRSKKLVCSIQNHAGNDVFEANEYFVKFALDSILGNFLNVEDSTDDMATWLDSMWHDSAARSTSVWYLFEFIYKQSAPGKKFKKTKQNYEDFINSIIKKWESDSMERIATFNSSNKRKELLNLNKLEDHLRLISEGNGKFTTEELHGEIGNIIIAGVETTASTIGYALILLGIYPDIQKKLFQEITQTLGTRKNLEYEDLKELHYLEKIIMETLRLFPPLVGIGRYIVQEIQLTNHVVPAKASVLIPLFTLHRDPNIWHNPNEFNPDRFLPEEEAKRHPCSWIPFSLGPRNCIGMRYANIALKLVLATFILNYKVKTNYKSVEDIHLTMVTVIKPTKGYNISITSR